MQEGEVLAVLCCFKNVTTTFKVAVDKNWLDMQTATIDSSVFNFFVEASPNVFDTG